MITIQIDLHSGKTITATTDNYQADVLTQSLNDQRVQFISVGDAIINRNTIQLITPVPAQEPTA